MDYRLSFPHRRAKKMYVIYYITKHSTSIRSRDSIVFNVIYREGRPVLVSQPGYQRLTTTMPKPREAATRLSGTKSNALHGSSNSLNQSQLQDEMDSSGSSRTETSALDHNADKISMQSNSRSVTVAE